MAWQVLALKLTGPSPLVREPRVEEIVPLGGAEEVRRLISAFLPTVDWLSDPTRGHFVAEDDSFTLNIHINEDPLEACMIDVRGGSESMPVLVALAKAAGWQLYDCSADWIDLDNPSYAGWEGYNGLRQAHLQAKERPEA